MITTLLLLVLLPLGDQPPIPRHLAPQESVPIRFDTRERFGGSLHVEAGEVYRIYCPPGQRWKDSWYPTGPAGFYNPLLHLFKPRLRGAPCHAVCAGVGQQSRDDEHLYHIGQAPLDSLTVPVSGALYFFVNDYWGAYRNNHGCVEVVVERLQ